MNLGEQLVAARKRAGLTLDELSAKTRIRAGLLQAMEAGDFGACGGNFYARGHLRTIAKVLGADADRLIVEFDARHAAPEIEPSRHEGPDARPVTVYSARPRWAVVMGAILVGLMGWGMVRLFTLPSDVEASAMQGAPAPSVTVTQTKKVTPPPVRRTAEPKPKPTRVRLTVVADHEGTYLALRNFNGDYLFSGSLTRGVQQTLTYKGLIRVTVEVPRNARYFVNGKRVYPKMRRFTVNLDGTVEKR